MPIAVLQPTRRGPVAIVVAALLFLTACGADAESATTTAAPSTTTAAPATTTSSAPTTTTTAPPTDEDLILEAAENYWYAILAANTDPVDSAHPDLMRWVTGPALARAQENVRNREAAGLAAKLPDGAVFEVTAEVLERDEAGAIVRTCLVDEAVEYAVDTGEVTDSERVVLESRLRVLEVVDDRWEVSANLPTEDSGTCE